MKVAGVDVESNDDILNLFIERSAVLKGHFLLSSGLHSDTYIQCAKLHEDPTLCEYLCSLLLEKVQKDSREFLDVDVVVSPAMGAVLFGYEIARQLKKNFVFLERVDGNFALRRGFYIEQGAKVLIVEDVITTGKSSLEVCDIVTSMGGKVSGELSIVNRSKDVQMPFKTVSLLSLDIKNYAENEVPEDLNKVPITKPGSRFISK